MIFFKSHAIWMTLTYEKTCFRHIYILQAKNYIVIESSDVYFFRLYADFTDEGYFENI